MQRLGFLYYPTDNGKVMKSLGMKQGTGMIKCICLLHISHWQQDGRIGRGKTPTKKANKWQ